MGEGAAEVLEAFQRKSMHPDTGRMRTVNLYISHGKKATATVQRLGCQSKKNLPRWRLRYAEITDPAKERRKAERHAAQHI